MHDEDVVDEVEAVRLGLERVGHHLPHLVGVQLGELVYVLAARQILNSELVGVFQWEHFIICNALLKQMEIGNSNAEGNIQSHVPRVLRVGYAESEVEVERL